MEECHTMYICVYFINSSIHISPGISILVTLTCFPIKFRPYIAFMIQWLLDSYRIVALAMASYPCSLQVLYEMPSLNAIIADNNEIDRVDAVSLQQLPQLSALDLSNNSIRVLPPKLSLCPSLRSLLVQGNLFKVPGNQVIDQGSATLLDWLRSRIPQ